MHDWYDTDTWPAVDGYISAISIGRPPVDYRFALSDTYSTNDPIFFPLTKVKHHEKQKGFS